MGAYQSFMATVEMPPMVTGFQLQELLTYMEAAYEVRMNTAALMGMDPALLAFLRMLEPESIPEGTGAMGPPMQCGKHHRAPQCAQPRHPGVPHAGGTSAAPAVPPLEVPRSDTGLYPGRLLSPLPYLSIPRWLVRILQGFFTFFCFACRS